MSKKGEKVKKPKKTGRRKIERPAPMEQTTGQPSGQTPSMSGAGQEQGSQVMDQSNAQGAVYAPKDVPSQAEGERETVEEDLRDKGESS